MTSKLDYLFQWIRTEDCGAVSYGVCILSGLIHLTVMIQLHKGVHFTLDIRLLWVLACGINLTLWNPMELSSVPS